MLLVPLLDRRAFRLCHEFVAFLPRHRREPWAFLPANLGEYDLGELAFCCTTARQRPKPPRNFDSRFRLLDHWCCLRPHLRLLRFREFLCLRSFLLGLHVSVPPRTGANHKLKSFISKPLRSAILAYFGSPWNFSPVISPVRSPAYTYLGVLGRSPTPLKWLEVPNHATLTR